MENPIKMDDLGVPLFVETPTCKNVSIKVCTLALIGECSWMFRTVVGGKKHLLLNSVYDLVILD